MKVADDFVFETAELEQNEELEVVAWAENHGWIVRKIQYIGRRGCPDRLFGGYGKLFLIEMKRPAMRTKKGGGLSKGQVDEIAAFAAAGIEIKVFYTGAEAIGFLRRHTDNLLV